MKKVLNNALIMALFTGFISVSVNASQASVYDIIMTNTSFSIGIDEEKISISSLKQQGVKITYQVDTDLGRQYRCYVTSTTLPTGPIVSDAMCQEKGKPFQNPLLR